MIAIGTRAETITYVDRRPLYWIPPGKTGTVVRAGRDFIAIEMDEPVEGLEGCRNQARFTSDDCGMYWWQTWLDAVEKVCRYHFVIFPEAAASLKNRGRNISMTIPSNSTTTQPTPTGLAPGTLVVCAYRMPSIDQPWLHPIYIGIVEASGTDLSSWNGRNPEAYYCEATGTARVSYDFGQVLHDRVCDLMPITTEQAALTGRERVRFFIGAVGLWQLERYNHKTRAESEAYWNHLEDFVPPGTLVISTNRLPSPCYPWKGEIRVGTVEAPETGDEAARCQIQSVVCVRYHGDDVQYEKIGALMPITAEQAALGTREKIEYFLGAVAAWKYDQHLREEG